MLPARAASLRAAAVELPVPAALAVEAPGQGLWPREQVVVVAFPRAVQQRLAVPFWMAGLAARIQLQWQVHQS